MLFQMCEGIGNSISKKTRSSHFKLCLLLFLYEYPCKTTEKNDVTVREKYEIHLLISDKPINVSCKFEMLIFEIALVIKHYVQFVFLVVHTVVFVVI